MASSDIVTQLNSARDIVLRDPAIYPQVVPGVLPVIGQSQPLELRRWGSDFLAETFASPVVSEEEKRKLCLAVLDTLKGYLHRKEDVGEEEDASVQKSAIQCAASIYHLVFRHVITSPAGDAETAKEAWTKMTALKTAILRRMDTAPAGVRVCCIKFAARVVQTQTPGVIADPRRPEQNEVSLALLPRDHPVLVPSILEAEASGLLDRLLSVFQDNVSDAIIVTSTLNALATLVQRRASISAKILSTILAFNPNRATATPVEKVAVKSMTRTTISFLNNVLKRSPSHPLIGRIQGTIDRLRQSLHDAFTQQQQPNGLKRGAEDSIDGLHPIKRQQLGAEADLAQQQSFDGPLPPGPVSFKDLYTLGSDRTAAGFHVEVLPNDIIARLVPPLLQAIDTERFQKALDILRARIVDIQQRPPIVAPGLGGGHLDVEEDEEDYDPNAIGFGMDASEQHDPAMASMVQQRPIEEVIRLPPEPPLSEQEILDFGEQVRERLFGALGDIDNDLAKRKNEKRIGEVEKVYGFNKSVVAANGGQDREGWITLLIRLATRTNFTANEREDEEPTVKNENEDRSLIKRAAGSDLASRIRLSLNRYVMDDWRRRIDVAIAWLNEEWYAAQVTAQSTPPEIHLSPDAVNYERLALSLLDQMVPYLDIKDGRYLIRFLSEIPTIPEPTFERIKKIAEDPERVHLSTQALLYLIMLKPPARESAIECAVDIWRENKDAKASVEKVLVKWRPEVLKEEQMEDEAGGEVKTEA